MRGKLIVFEGGEGAGKTTQIQRTREWLEDSGWLAKLQAHQCVTDILVTREPGGTALGQSLRQLLLHTTAEPLTDRAELLLYAADRAQHVDHCLEPALAAGQLVLCDRYTASTVAYQGYGRQLDQDLIAQLNQIATQGLTSDLTLWLDVPPDVGLARTQKRGTADRIEASDHAFHDRVRQGFASVLQQAPYPIARLDASATEAEIQQAIQHTLVAYFEAWYGAALAANS